MRTCTCAIVVLAACGNGGTKCALPAAPWSATLVFASTNSGDYTQWSAVDLVEGGQLPLLAAPQGGHIVLVGARVDGGDGCDVEATAALRDPSTQRVIALDARPMPLGTDGVPVSSSALAAMPNVGVCPSAVSTTSLDGATVRVEVTLADATHTPRAMLAADAVLACADDYCRTDCAPH